MQQKYSCLPTTPVYCADTIPCKIMMHLPVFTLCLIIALYCVQQVC